MKRYILCGIATALACAVSPAGAAIIYDTGQPDNPQQRYYLEAGSTTSVEGTIYAQFQATVNTINQLEGWFWRRNALTQGLVTISLFANGADAPTGQALAAQDFDIRGPAVPNFVNEALIGGTFNNVAVTVGARYWVGFTNKSLSDLTGMSTVRYPGSFGYIFNGAALPPSIGIGFRVGGYDAVQAPPDDPVTPAVPEPATWATMILGFGIVGGALRRRAARMAVV